VALADALEPELQSLAEEVVAEIGRAIPEYRRPLEGAFGRGLRTGVQRSLQQFVDLVGRAGDVPASSREIYRELGRGELGSGRGLDALQAAYRLGTRLSWRRLSAAAQAHGADAATVSLLAESIFAYIEEISASSVEGYAQAQAELAGERDSRRRKLVRLLVDGGERPEEHTLRAAAWEASWELPGKLAALACELEDVPRLAVQIGGRAIGARVGEVTCVLIADPDGPGRREQIAAALERAAAGERWCATLGPTVAAAEAHLSFTRACAGLRLQRAGVLSPDGLLMSDDHLLTLLLHHDPAIAAELLHSRLRPLTDLPERVRVRMEQTLLAWLRHRGSIPAVAAELHVHRQTVRYRLIRLRELFGGALDDPERRLELELALRIGYSVG
jgi:hypothetical protein